MPYAVISGSKQIGRSKTRGKKSINSVLAKQFRKENKISVLKINTTKRKQKRRRKK